MLFKGNKDSRKNMPPKKIAMIAVCVVLGLILVLLVAAAIIMNSMMGKIDKLPENEGTLSSSELQEILGTETIGDDYSGPLYGEDEITLPSEAEKINNENKVNILLIGVDRRGTSYRGLSDAMILCTVDKEAKTLTMTSFLRDIYVTFPDVGKNKLNAAYPIGGVELLNKTLEYNFGVHIDGNVVVDFSQFSTIIDRLGGVDIELTGAEAEHLNVGNGFALHSGMNHLNGKEALAYSRIRYIGTDFGRTNRQRTVLTAILNQFRNSSVKQMTNTVTGILDLIATDMEDSEILGYVMDLAPMIQDVEITSQSIPVEGSYSFGSVKESNVVDCIFIDFDVNRQVLVDTLGE